MVTDNPSNRSRLGVEHLENRDVPSSFGLLGGESVEQVIGLLNFPTNPDFPPDNLFAQTVTGTGPGVRATVRIWTGDIDASKNLTPAVPTGQLLYTLHPFGNFRGGVFVRTGDVNGDGNPDLVCATGAGITGRVKVFTFQGGGIHLLANFTPFGPNYTGGIELGKPAHLSGAFPYNDPTTDAAVTTPSQIVVGTQHGAGVVKVFSYDTNSGEMFQTRRFTPFGAGYLGGVSLATGNVDAQEDDLNTPLVDQYNYDYAEVIVARASGLPQIKIYDVQQPTVQLKTSWMAFDITNPAYRHGLNLAAGNTDGNATNGGADTRLDYAYPGNTQNPGPVFEIYANLKGTGLIRGFYGNSSAAFATVRAYPRSYTGTVNMSVGGVHQSLGRDLVIVAADGPYSQQPVVYLGGSALPALLNGKTNL